MKGLTGLAVCATGVVLMALLFGDKASAAWRQRVDLSKDVATSEIVAGRWLEQAYPPESVVLYDTYAYIPPSFERATQSWGMDHDQVTIIDPDLIVTTESFHTRYLMSGGEDRYRGDAQLYLKRQDFYSGLAAGQESPYVLQKSFGPVHIYANSRTVGMAAAVGRLLTRGEVYLPVGWGRRVAPFVSQRTRLHYFVNEEAVVLPGKTDVDVLYAFPPWMDTAGLAFAKRWGDLLSAEQVEIEGSGGLEFRVFRLATGRLPDARTDDALLAALGVPSAGHLADVQFESGIRLLGYQVKNKTVRPDRPLEVNLIWLAETDQRRDDYTMFVHLLDPEQQLRGQVDRRPLEGSYLTGQWRAGDVVIDHYAIPVAVDAPGGDYWLDIGMYRLADGARLALVGPKSGTSALVGPFRVKVKSAD